MFLFSIEQPALVLRAMRTVALADGDETDKERSLLDAVRAALGLPSEPFDALDSPEPLMSLSPTDRERVVQCMLLMALMDGRGSRSEAALIERFARALEVTEQRIANLRQLAEGRLARMRFDLTRRGYASDELRRAANEDGLRGIYETFGPILGLGADPALARRYIALGELPAESLGRAYFEFILANDLRFPGERSGVAERGLWHDMTHVLGGYPTTPLGESCIVAFIAGYRRDDPFFWLFTIALQFQVGLKISPFSPGVVDAIDPAAFVRHHARGAKVTRDLSVGWDIHADLARPLDELRHELGIEGPFTL